MQNETHKVAIIGMGKTGLSVARYLQQQSIAFECFDEANVSLPDDLKGSVLHKGELNTELLLSYDQVIVSPGIDWRHPALLEVRKCGIPVHGDLEEFLKVYTGTLIAVTGTNGKTTTTQMIELLLETLPKGCEAGGNIGKPMLDLLNKGQPERVVLELSSFQLERAQGVHPHTAVLLNIQLDHADMHASQEAYREAKLGLFKHMIVGDTAVLPQDEDWKALAQDLKLRGVTVLYFGIRQAEENNENNEKELSAGILHHQDSSKKDAQLFWTQNGERQYIKCSKLMLRGEHQQQNIAVAAQVAADYGVSKGVIEEAMMSFQGLEHRLEFVGRIAGKDWFNDSKATNPEAAVAALTSFDKVIWICGGLRKDLSLDSLVDMVQAHVSYACVVGKDAKAYEAMLKQAGVPYVVSKTIEKAVKHAYKYAALDHEPVLLSPAAASQDQFKSYTERGVAFVKAIRGLKDA